jgi:hypothetical protein
MFKAGRKVALVHLNKAIKCAGSEMNRLFFLHKIGLRFELIEFVTWVLA